MVLSAAEEVDRAARRVREWLGERRPRIAVVFGSGLGGLTARLAAPIRLAYHEVPGLPSPGVAGHRGELLAGSLGGTPVLCQSGRLHGYEGHPPARVVLPVRVFARLGVEVLVVTGAAGAINRTLEPGSLLLLADHLNLAFRSPLAGPALPGEERFPDLSQPYDPRLRALARAAAREERIPLAEGIYAWVLGPSYETAAEIRMLDRLGADAVGMSTVPEVLAARARGLRVLGFSLITNRATGLSSARLSHEEVLQEAARGGERLGALIERVVEWVGTGREPTEGVGDGPRSQS
ncbi:MAG TPA: purine-nucleoside phosphorylase [Gemmatimonadales bacterium]|nr:purine-nucleoside phosphorylase [Gemmatimonadales bacterium]